MQKVISVVNQKGGTGKTTTALNLAVALQRSKKSTLLVDLDPQGSLSFSLGLTQPEKTLTDLFNGDAKISDTIHHIDGEEVDLIPTDIDLADVELNLVSYKNRTTVLKEALDTTKYDYVIVDCPPSLSLLTINALSTSNYVIIPFQLEVLSIRGLDQIIDSIKKIKETYNGKLKIMGLLPVMVDTRKKLTHEVYDYVVKNYSVNVFKNFIRTNVRLSEAPSFAQSVFRYAPKSNGALDYMKVANELIKQN